MNPSSRIIFGCVRAYGWLLWLYPRVFRREYGPEMMQAFEDRCREEIARGSMTKMVRVWGTVLSDLLLSVPLEHLKKGKIMNYRHLITAAGFLILLFSAATYWNQRHSRKTKPTLVDIVVTPSTARLTPCSNWRSAVMPASDRTRLLKVEGIQSVSPVLSCLDLQKGITVVFGIDLQSYADQVGGFKYLAGRPFGGSTENEILVDDIFAGEKGLRVGDDYILNGKSFRVCGVVRHGLRARIFARIETLQSMLGSKEGASSMLIKCQRSNQIQTVIQSIRKMLPTYEATATREG